MTCTDYKAVNRINYSPNGRSWKINLPNTQSFLPSIKIARTISSSSTAHRSSRSKTRSIPSNRPSLSLVYLTPASISSPHKLIISKKKRPLTSWTASRLSPKQLVCMKWRLRARTRTNTTSSRKSRRFRAFRYPKKRGRDLFLAKTLRATLTRRPLIYLLECLSSPPSSRKRTKR